MSSTSTLRLLFGWVLVLFLVAVGGLGASAAGLKFLGAGLAVGGEVVSVGSVDGRTLLTSGGDLYDIGDPTAPRRLGVTEWAGWDLASANGVGYLAVGRSGVVILDLRNPTQPARLGLFRASGDTRALEVEGTAAYLAAGDGGLKVLDVRDPSRPDQVGAYPSSLAESLTAHDVRVRGGVAYVAAGADTLEVLRVGNPASILRAGGLKAALDARFIDWIGTNVVLAGRGGEVQLVDITQPAKPAGAGRFPGLVGPSTVCHGIGVSGTLCYLAVGDQGIVIVDWADVQQPRLVGSYRASAPVVGLRVIGGRVFASHGASGFSILEPVASVEPPPRITAQPVGLVLPLGAAARFEVGVNSGTAVSFQWLFRGIPIPGALGPVLSLSSVGRADEGEYVVVVSGGGGSVTSDVVTLRIAEPPILTAQPEDVVRVEGGAARLWVGVATGVGLSYQWYRNGEALSGATEAGLDFRSLTPGDAGTYAVRVSNAAGSVVSRAAELAVRARVNLRPVGRWPAVPDGEYARRLRVVGDVVYLAHGMAGLEVLDVRTPSEPRRIGGYAGSGFATGLQVVGNRLYLADGNIGGLVVLDVSDPSRPVRLGQFNPGTPVSDVEVVGDLAYLTAGGDGLVIVDVRRAEAMVRVGAFGDTYGASSIEVSGRWAYLADGPGGLLVMDAGDPAKPLPVAQFAKSAFGEYSVRDVRVKGTLAFVACTYDGLRVADISDPAHPIGVGHVTGYSHGVHVSGHHAYVGGYDTGLRVLDVTTVRPPMEVGFLDTPGEVNDIDTAGSLVFVADGKNGLVILESGGSGGGGEGVRLEWVRSSDTGTLRVRCPGDLRAVLERSMDLKVWTQVQTNAPSGDAAWSEFIIEAVPAPGAAFFRVVR